jgi:hypothetical protein
MSPGKLNPESIGIRVACIMSNETSNIDG